jgi:hypothetical protein
MTLGNWFSPFSLRQVLAAAVMSLEGIVKLLGESRDLGELDRAGAGYAACLMPQTSCHAWKARVRSAR